MSKDCRVKLISQRLDLKKPINPGVSFHGRISLTEHISKLFKKNK